MEQLFLRFFLHTVIIKEIFICRVRKLNSFGENERRDALGEYLLLLCVSTERYNWILLVRLPKVKPLQIDQGK